MIRFLLIISFNVFSLLAADLEPNDQEYQAQYAKTKSRLKQIGLTYAMYFTDDKKVILPTPDIVEVDPGVRNYTNPQTGKLEKFLYVQPGYVYSGSSQLLLAVTEKPISGLYLACFEDGHVATITADQFKQHIFILGLKKNKVNYKELDAETQQDLTKLIAQLGAKKFKERKAAKAKLLSRSPEIIQFLEQNLNNPNFEIKVSIQEVIKELRKKEVHPLMDRPKL